MRLFKRKKPQASLCPRCGQLVSEADALVCPMCGWDLREAYQGPTSAPRGQTPTTMAPTDSYDGETSADRRA